MKELNRFTIAAFVFGFSSIIAGATWIYRPLGLLAGGCLLILAAFASMRSKS